MIPYHSKGETIGECDVRCKSESRISPLPCVYSYITAPSEPKLAAHRSQHSNNSKKQKLLLFKRCHRPSLCTGLIKSSLVDKLLIQNLKKSLTLSTIAFLSCLASFPYVYFHTKRPLSLYQFLGGEMRRISETIPCDYLPLPLRHVRPVQSQHEARVITLFLRVQELLYRGTSGVVA